MRVTMTPLQREKTEAFVGLLKKWNAVHNLIAASELLQGVARPIQESCLFLDHMPVGGQWLDMGSGNGFPAVILSIMSPMTGMAVEVRAKKAAFLQEVVRRLDLSMRVHVGRIEKLAAAEEGRYDIVTARGLAPLKDLWRLGERFLKPDGCALFLKGNQIQKEWEDLPNPLQESGRFLKKTPHASLCLFEKSL